MDTNEAKKVCGLLKELLEARKEGCGHTVHWGDDLDAVINAMYTEHRVEALEAGIQYAIRTMGAGDGKEAVLECIDALEALLQRPAAKDPAA